MALAVVAGISGPAFAIAGVDFPTYNFKECQAVLDAGDYEKALPMLEEFIRFEPENAEAHNLLGYARRNLGKLDEAMESYNKALSFNPQHMGTLEYQGELFLKLNDKAAAEGNLAKLKEICPTGCEAYDVLQAAIERFKDGAFAWTPAKK
ncbi:MAG: tetratricopeptide repeat protein [Rhodospirillaceae bacterium]|nr:tetratricopeptide repeat protein [Rhodospirillaceae bacterium]